MTKFGLYFCDAPLTCTASCIPLSRVTASSGVFDEGWDSGVQGMKPRMSRVKVGRGERRKEGIEGDTADGKKDKNESSSSSGSRSIGGGKGEKHVVTEDMEKDMNEKNGGGKKGSGGRGRKGNERLEIIDIDMESVSDDGVRKYEDREGKHNEKAYVGNHECENGNVHVEVLVDNEGKDERKGHQHGTDNNSNLKVDDIDGNGRDEDAAWYQGKDKWQSSIGKNKPNRKESITYGGKDNSRPLTGSYFTQAPWWERNPTTKRVPTEQQNAYSGSKKVHLKGNLSRTRSSDTKTNSESPKDGGNTVNMNIFVLIRSPFGGKAFSVPLLLGLYVHILNFICR